MSNIVPELIVENMQRSRDFYEMLGFAVANEGIVDENGSQWYSMEKDGNAVWLLRRDTTADFQEGHNPGNGIHLYMSVDNVDELHEKVRLSGLQMNIVKELETMWYGLREFKLADPDGFVWTLNTPVDTEAQESMGDK